MTRAFRAEWIKLRRPAALAGTVGLLAALALLATILTVLLVETGSAGGAAGEGSAEVTTTITVAELSQPDGLMTMFNLVGGTFAPLLALVLFAANVGGEYRHGTLRLLLVHQPARHLLLAGKVAALALVLTLALLAAFAVTAAAGFALAPVRDVDTAGWLTGDGLAAVAAGLVNTLVRAFGWGLVGLLVAVVTRSSAAAIGVGAGYLLLAENVIAGLWDGARAWLPGQVLTAFGAGGTEAVSYGQAGTLTAVYLVVLAAAAGAVLSRRDVTD